MWFDLSAYEYNIEVGDWDLPHYNRKGTALPHETHGLTTPCCGGRVAG